MKLNKKIFILSIVISLFLIHSVSALVLNAYITDNADKITPEYKTKIEQLITKVEQNTSVEIAVLTVKDMGGKTIEQFSEETATASGIGKDGKDNGILITVAETERKWRIEVGYGLEGTITDAQAKIIGERYLKPSLAAGNWGMGIYDTIEQINNELTKEDIPETTNMQSTSAKLNYGLFWIAVFMVILIFFVVVIVLLSFSGLNSNSNTSDYVPTYTPSTTSVTKKKRKTEETSSYHSSGNNYHSDDEDHTDYHHSYYSGGYDSSDSGSSFGGFGGGGFGGGGASGGF